MSKPPLYYFNRVGKELITHKDMQGKKFGRKQLHWNAKLGSALGLWQLVQFSSVAQSCPCPSPTPGGYSNLCPSSQWCHPTISYSVVPLPSYPQFFPASGSFPMNQFFLSGGQSIGVSASTSALPMNTQDWSPLGWIGWISLQSKGLSRVFSNTTVQKHQFFSAQISSQPNSHIHTWLLEKP